MRETRYNHGPRCHKDSLAYTACKGYNTAEPTSKPRGEAFMTDKELVELLKCSVSEWNQWRQQHPKILPNFRDADLRSTNLSRANLSYVYLSNANLSYV